MTSGPALLPSKMRLFFSGEFSQTPLAFLPLTVLAGDEQRHNSQERPATDDRTCDLLVFCDRHAGYHQGTESNCEATPQPVRTSPNPMPDSFQFESVSMCLLGFKRCQKSLGHPGNNFVVQTEYLRGGAKDRRSVVQP